MKCECGASYVDADRAITQPVPTSTPSNAPKNPYNASKTFFKFIKTSFRVFKSTHHPTKPSSPKSAALLDASAAKVPRKWDYPTILAVFVMVFGVAAASPP